MLAIYDLGWLTDQVIGSQILKAFEALLARLPIIKSVYGSVKKLIGVLQSKPDNVERVLPVDDLVSTDWTMDEAMIIVISGGAIARNKVLFSSAREGT